MADITDNELINYDAVSIGNLRNGNVDTIVATTREASIAAEYYYAIPLYESTWDGNPGARIPGLKPGVIVNIAIRTCFAKLCKAHVDAERAAHGLLAAAGGAAFDEDAKWAEAAVNAGYRKRAIALGSAVAAAVFAYRITKRDVNSTETGAEIYSLASPTRSADDDAYRAAGRTANAGWKATLKSGHAAAAYNNIETAAQNMGALTAVEQEISAMCFIMGSAAPPRAGATLVKSKHHYLSDANNRRRHLACEKQVRLSESADAKAWFTDDPNSWRDMIWHKSIHPIKVEILEDLAADPKTAERLDASGYGAFSVGIPAQEDMIARAGSYVAIYNATRDNIRTSGSIVEYPRLVTMYSIFLTMPKVLSGVAIAGWEGKEAGPPPSGITTRKDAVNIWLKPELENCAARAAWMFGWYREVCQRMNISSSSQEGSLLRSYSLRKAMENHLPMASEGQNAYTAFQRYMRNMTDEGKMPSYNYRDA